MEKQSVHVQKMRPSLFEGLLKCNCPQCRQVNLFVHKNPYHLKDMHIMSENCPGCQFNVSQEPGFYWGAMYVSYGLSVGFSIVYFSVFYCFFGWLSDAFIITNTVLLILIIPLVFRYARVIWLYLFGKQN